MNGGCHELSRNNFLVDNGRGDWIRTSGPLLPKQMRYQAALLPDPVLRHGAVGPAGFEPAT